MGTATVPKHDLPSGLRTLKGSTLVSNSQRLRSRSYSREHELHRAGLGKDVAGEWSVVRRGVPPSLVDAMRKMALRSKRRSLSRRATRSLSRSEVRSRPTSVGIKMEQMTFGNHEMIEATHDANTASYADNEDIDMTDAAAVFEEIRVYINVDSVEGGHKQRTNP